MGVPWGDSTSSPTGQALGETPPGSASGCWTRLALLGSVNWEEETGSHWPYWEGGAAPAPRHSGSCGRGTGSLGMGLRKQEGPWAGWLLMVGFVLGFVLVFGV